MSRPPACVLVPVGAPRRRRPLPLGWIALLAYVAALEAVGLATASHAFTATTDVRAHPAQVVVMTSRESAR